jgi:hypothetical protein
MNTDNNMGLNGFVWFIGVVEDNASDPLKLGRVKVRCVGWHTDDKTLIPTKDLPWSHVMLPVTSASMNGIGDAPVGLLNGSHVIGFFRDGTKAQEPVIIGSIPGIPEDAPISALGYNDPNARYPLQAHLNEPDTNRLARCENLSKTLVTTKNNSRDLDIPIANGTYRTAWASTAQDYYNIKWDQPVAPYNAIYPSNHVKETESGHVLEFDDSPGTERIHLWHRTGSFIEYDRNGTKVDKIVGDSYEIIDRNGFIHIKGKAHITVDGDSKIYVKNNVELQVDGNVSAVIKNNATLDVSGTASVSVGEAVNILTPVMNIETTDFNVKTATMNITCSSAYDLHTNEYKRTSDDRSDIRFNGDRWTWIGADTYNRHDDGTDYSCPADPIRGSGINCDEVETAEDSPVSGLVSPVPKQSVVVPAFKPLNIVTRIDHVLQGNDDHGNGLPQEEVIAATNEGLINGTPDPKEGTVEEVAPVQGAPSNPNQDISEEDAVKETIADMEKVSNFFVLADFTTRPAASRYRLQANAGLTEGEIFANIKHLAKSVADPIKAMYPDMMITSAFRVSGSNPKSQHLRGEAMDIQFSRLSTAKGLTMKDIRKGYFDIAKELSGMIPFDQLLLEFKSPNVGTGLPWIHISYTRKSNRGQILTFNNNAKYGTGLHLIQVT